jgi:RNA polymerase sigma-B factor
MLNEDLTGLDDRGLLGIVRLSPRASERRAAACELLVSRYRGLVWSCVRRYLRSPEPAEDLMQVGYIGLLKAINNFDPAICGSLVAYAGPCISGEIKRHFRDRRWQIHVKRPVQELILEVREATWRLTQELGRTPTESDIARHLGISADDLRQAQRAELAFQPSSLDAPPAGQPSLSTLADILGEEDPRIEHMLGMQAVVTHWGELPRREQEILLMYFRGGMTQREIGQRLLISQMHVSRLIAHALGYLRSRMLDLEGTRATAGPAVAPQPPKGHESAIGADRLCTRRGRISGTAIHLADATAGSEVLGGHPPAVRADEERDHVCDILGLSEPAERRHFSHHLLALGAVVVAQHVSVGRSGRNGVDSNASLAEFVGGDDRELLDGALAGGVKRDARYGQNRVDGGHVDDPSAVGHAPGGLPQGFEDGPQVDLHHPLVVFVGQLG